ncbi:MAG: glycine--tRNA ligase subunit beta [bacterium]
MSEDVLLEIGCEEIPAGYIAPAIQQIKQLAQGLLEGERIKYKDLHVFATPRRLTLYIDKVAQKQEDVVCEVTGPPKKVAIDENGQYTKAAVGFAASQGVKVSDLSTKNTERGEYVVAIVAKEGKPVKEVLPDLFGKIIRKIDFPKTMRWLDEDIYFARPIRWIVAMLGSKVVKLSLGPIKSSNKTCGHFVFSPKKLHLKQAKDYKVTLKNNYVLVDHDERRKIVCEQISKLASKTGGGLLEDGALLDTVIQLIEYPTAVLGSFKEDYLKLPKEVLITSMRTHQKFFSLVDKSGNLLPFFITVKNGPSQFIDIVKEGNERVLDARLADAEFFFKQDRKKSLDARSDELKNVVFQEELGTLYDKTQRIKNLSIEIAKKLGCDESNIKVIKRIAHLSKVDVITEMVKEFPELQGVMGRVYAGISGEDSKVAIGIQEHLMPLTAESKLPDSLQGAVVSIADKMDTLIGDFAVGLIPTGSQDPYGLRRQAQGVVRIILNKKMDISLDELIEKGLDLIEVKTKISDRDATKKKLMDFLGDRMEAVMSGKGLRYDEINSVLVGDFSNLVNIMSRGKAIHKQRKLEGFDSITGSFKRAKNILKQSESKGIGVAGLCVKDDLLKQDQEKTLHERFKDIENKVESSITSSDYEQALGDLVSLRKPIDEFFDNVMVMDKDEAVRENRLALLSEIVGLFLKVADFSKIVVEKEG